MTMASMHAERVTESPVAPQPQEVQHAARAAVARRCAAAAVAEGICRYAATTAALLAPPASAPSPPPRPALASLSFATPVNPTKPRATKPRATKPRAAKPRASSRPTTTAARQSTAPRRRPRRRLPAGLARALAKRADDTAMRGHAAAAALGLPRMPLEARRARLRALRAWDQPEQRTPAWYAMRDNMVTASDFGGLLGSDRALRTFARRKAAASSAARAAGGGRPTGGSACQHGVLCEPVCQLVYERLRDARVEEFGLLRHAEHAFVGASPDGICDERSAPELVGRLVEFKAPYSREIVPGAVPKKYLAQIQGQLEVTQMDLCDYLECSLRVVRDGWGDNETNRETDNRMRGVIRRRRGEAVPEYGAIGALDALPMTADTEYRATWTLVEHNLVEVRRSPRWFADVLLPRLQLTWTTIEALREARASEVAAAAALAQQVGELEAHLGQGGGGGDAEEHAARDATALALARAGFR
jgi:hypothetical protein